MMASFEDNPINDLSRALQNGYVGSNVLGQSLRTYPWVYVKMPLETSKPYYTASHMFPRCRIYK